MGVVGGSDAAKRCGCIRSKFQAMWWNGTERSVGVGRKMVRSGWQTTGGTVEGMEYRNVLWFAGP